MDFVFEVVLAHYFDVHFMLTRYISLFFEQNGGIPERRKKKKSTTETLVTFECSMHAHTANLPYPDLVVRKYGLFQKPLLIVRKGKCPNLPVHLTSFLIEVIWLCVQHVPYWCCYQHDQNLNFSILDTFSNQLFVKNDIFLPLSFRFLPW